MLQAVSDAIPWIQTLPKQFAWLAWGTTGAALAWKFFRAAGTNGKTGSSDEMLVRARNIDAALMAWVAESKTQTFLLQALVESAKETARYQQEGREAMAKISRIEAAQ